MTTPGAVAPGNGSGLPDGAAEPSGGGAGPGVVDSLLQHLEIARNLRHLQIRFDVEKCKGRWECYEVCPIGCWTPDRDARVATFHDPELCIACGACVLQCPEDAIALER